MEFPKFPELPTKPLSIDGLPNHVWVIIKQETFGLMTDEVPSDDHSSIVGVYVSKEHAIRCCKQVNEKVIGPVPFFSNSKGALPAFPDTGPKFPVPITLQKKPSFFANEPEITDSFYIKHSGSRLDCDFEK